MKDTLTIIGAHGKRRENDFYPTPPEVTVALLKFLEKRFLLRGHDTIWEPACGDGAMFDVMMARGYTVIGTDISSGHDYLTTDQKMEYDWIITNPPFSVSAEFIERSIKRNKPFAFLLKTQYWHSAKRFKLFTEYPPSFVLPLTWRPSFTGQKNSLLDVIWCVWIGATNITQYIPLEKPKGANDERKAD